MLHPAAQATLSSILLPGVQGYTQSTPSPPPGLAPIDKQPSGVPDCSSSSCTLNGHVKVKTAALKPTQAPAEVTVAVLLCPGLSSTLARSTAGDRPRLWEKAF